MKIITVGNPMTAPPTTRSLPITVTKKQLCFALGLYSPITMRPYSDKLRKDYLTDDILAHLGITPSVFDRRGGYTFDVLKTKKLFQLIEELKELEF